MGCGRRIAGCWAAAGLVLAGACRGPRGGEAGAHGDDLHHLEAPGAIGPYSAAVTAGDLVFLAGKVGEPGLSFKAEVESAIDRVEADLRRLGLDLSDVVSVNVFVTDMALFAELNEIYAARFRKPYPARTTVGVASLPKGMRVELQAVARRR